MQRLRFNPDVCLKCETIDCIMRCQYIHLELERAKEEHDRLVLGQRSSILENCVTCYACEEYCPHGNHPFYQIVEQQELLDIHPVPRPIEKSQVIMMGPRGKIGLKEVHEPLINMCFFGMMKGGIRGRIFEGASTIGGADVFCNLMFLHFARNSTIKERLPLMIDNIMRFHLDPSGVDELICYHDECYGTYTSWAPAFGVQVPFKPVHLFDFILRRMLSLKGEIRPLGFKVAYQRPCSSRLCPETDRLADELFALIGVERPQRRYEYDRALCCAGVIEAAQRFDLAEENRMKNVEDMKAAGAQYAVFNCPFCFWTLAEPVMKAGMAPVMMSDLCLMALGQ